MLPRHYSLICDDTVKAKNQKMKQEKSVKSAKVAVPSYEDFERNINSNFKCEVRKSPRAPEYEIHMVREKSGDYNKLPISVSVKKKRKRARKPSDPVDSHRTDSSVTATDDSRIESDATTDKENHRKMVGIRVIACYNKDGLYYPGHVSSTKESVYAMVNFNFKKKQKVRTQMIIPISGAIPSPELARGDFVLVRVHNQQRQLECYVPGIVEFLPDARQTPRFFTILMYNGQTATTTRRCIVKIGSARFDMAVKYIAHIQQARLRTESMKAAKSSPGSQRSDSVISDSQSESSNHKHGRHSTKPRFRQSSAAMDDSDRSSLYSDYSTTQSERSSKSSVRSDRTLTDGGGSDRSSLRSGQRRRKKEKYTKRIAKTKDHKKRSSSRKKSRSRSSSRSRSHSRSQTDSRSASSRSRSRSTSRSRSRSATPASGRTKSSNSSRSRSSSRTYTGSSSRSYSRSRSRSYSRSRSRSRSKSRSRSRSRSRSKRSFRSYSSGSRSRSESRTSRSSSRSRTPTPRRKDKHVGSKSKSRSRSRNSDSSGSTTPCNSPIERPSNPVPKPRPNSPPLRTNSIFNNVTRTDIYAEDRGYDSRGQSRVAVTDEKDQVIGDLQYQLEKQRRKQLRQEQRLVRQARKINKIQSRLGKNQHNSSMQSDKSKSTVRSSSEDTDSSPHRRKGSPDGTSFKDTSDLLGSRRSLPGLRRGQEVLARWTDDGWYYRGRVERERGDNCYEVQDATGYAEMVGREDILTDEEQQLVQPQDYVIALHPKYVFSYAPAEVLDTYVNDNVRVEFYDGVTHTVPSEEVYKVGRDKYESDRRYIMDKERAILGKSVIARDDDSGVYKLGMVDSHCGLGQLYYVKWQEGMVCKQNANHIFPVSQRGAAAQGALDFVLAPADQHGTVYKPARVDKEDSTVIFCDGNSSSRIRLDQCFWINKRYYKNAVDFYVSKN